MKFKEYIEVFEYIEELNKDKYLAYGDKLEKLDEKLTNMGLKFMEKHELIEMYKRKLIQCKCV